MLEMVAVGAIATQLRVAHAILRRSGRSAVPSPGVSLQVDIDVAAAPRCSIRICSESSGRMPLDHSEPW